MEDNSYVPVIPDIKDQTMRAPPAPPVTLPTDPVAEVVSKSNWWDWSTWPLALKLAMGTLIVAFILLTVYAGYVWFTGRQEKTKTNTEVSPDKVEKQTSAPKAPSVQTPPVQAPPDMNEILKTQMLMKQRKEELLRQKEAQKPVEEPPKEPPKDEEIFKYMMSQSANVETPVVTTFVVAADIPVQENRFEVVEDSDEDKNREHKIDFHNPSEVIPGGASPDNRGDDLEKPLPSRILQKPKLAVPLAEESDTEDEGVLVDEGSSQDSADEKKKKIDSFLM